MQHRAVGAVACVLPPVHWLLSLLLIMTSSGLSAASVGTWTTLANQPPISLRPPHPLSDGSILFGTNGQGDCWCRLVPDASGGYVNGTWSMLPPMHELREFAGSVLLSDGSFLIAGGEYGTGIDDLEHFDPVTGTWTFISSWMQGDIGDSTVKVMPDGRVLLFPRLQSCAWIYDPNADSWTQTAAKLTGDINDEESVVQLPSGAFLSVDVWHTQRAQRYEPASDTWIDCGTVPVNLVDSKDEIGPGVLLADGRVFYLGATGTTAFYTPPAAQGDPSPGTWQAGPPIPSGLCADDVSAVLMPNGHVLFACDIGGSGFTPPTSLYEFDPVASVYLSVPSPSTSLVTNSAACNTMMQLLPTGQVLVINNGYWLYTPVGTADPTWAPTLDTVTANPDGTCRVTGTRFNGLSEGSYYGDDQQNASNFPLVCLVSASNQVTYARTYGFSSMGVALGTTPCACSFSVPTLPSGTYTVSVIVNGIASNSLSLVIALPAEVSPAITSTPVLQAPINAIAPYIYHVTATGSPAPTYALTAGPTGMTIDPTTGVIGWRPQSTTPSSASVTVVASNGVAPAATQTFTVQVQEAPGMNLPSAGFTTASVGSRWSDYCSSYGLPQPTITVLSAPAGFAYNAATQFMSWTPSAAGSYLITCMASNGVQPDFIGSFTITVTGGANSPAFTTTPSSTGVVGQAYAYQAAATGTPTPTFSLVSGPAGMTVSATGSVSWTPSAIGTFTIVIDATNGVAPDAQQQYAVTVNGPPTITSSPVTTAVVGQAYTTTITATGAPSCTFRLTSVAPHMSLDPASGIITWTPTAAGMYPVTVVASNGLLPDASQSFSIAVSAAPTITSTAITTAVLGQAYAYTVSANGTPAPTFALTTHPAGMSINPGSGAIMWTPTSTGPAQVTVDASNGVLPDALQSFTVMVDASPQITSTAITSATVGQLYSATVAASGTPVPTFSISAGPSGMTIDAVTGAIRWTPTSAGPSPVTVVATNGTPPDATQTFTITVADATGSGTSAAGGSTGTTTMSPATSGSGHSCGLSGGAAVIVGLLMMRIRRRRS